MASRKLVALAAAMALGLVPAVGLADDGKAPADDLSRTGVGGSASSVAQAEDDADEGIITGAVLGGVAVAGVAAGIAFAVAGSGGSDDDSGGPGSPTSTSTSTATATGF
ncbi:MAG: hypothetical protein QNJ67_23570 [Kiloniellales bacterium]|nr:hypothetical protein [Kiloniellales bacterium]